MNKAKLIDVIAAKAEVPKRQAEIMLETVLETITSTIKSGGEVTLTGFGAFSARKRAARMGVNPQRPKEKIQIPEVTVPKFKAGKALKDALKS
ncbi:hypothetical protein A3H10_02515 [Candidatus Uhrbacteria bacterium RIFCSPLOWO2_12_FULL_46_10]|uniref:DNA-binding protein HU n=1 Tax=Candidatus Uhrbacteria bacterium RIFCSPLOWO2_01_FULL_47_25 TaxID=1802402 RepID=A0A1F7UXN7_9BACT|nr:MAG: DNA-binding protein HU-beta [Parcubacteria group bacterium GW2011_GWA2_46_9]OGL58887.1 MAG: hypothetical protein A2752_04890 [Candidatus Uhrbacteria bacterium RIFCSPHIGHO2_01_FULL_46_23]OGL69411.1 MAG: hypothetical protein A3D60_01045 [Candidatus Uhrbacteria bacterium RIFCSPHIGHO2_02_FULL_47_29]OGL76787.1 MAG: hypothetical protein A3E96_01595 [Candidatus Uhrbacteria bacterium RIFCSPHIGHO2_12_FULL_46_13]OGL82427.1 MAG: hypothetical protein A2936_03145 [Candidatus Uhrbacteria bacterium RI